MNILSMICNNMYNSILNTLQLVQIKTSQFSEQRVTMIQTTTNQGICSKNGYFMKNSLQFNSMEVIYLEETDFTRP